MPDLRFENRMVLIGLCKGSELLLKLLKYRRKKPQKTKNKLHSGLNALWIPSYVLTHSPGPNDSAIFTAWRTGALGGWNKWWHTHHWLSPSYFTWGRMTNMGCSPNQLLLRWKESGHEQGVRYESVVCVFMVSVLTSSQVSYTELLPCIQRWLHTQPTMTSNFWSTCSHLPSARIMVVLCPASWDVCMCEQRHVHACVHLFGDQKATSLSFFRGMILVVALVETSSLTALDFAK